MGCASSSNASTTSSYVKLSQSDPVGLASVPARSPVQGTGKDERERSDTSGSTLDRISVNVSKMKTKLSGLTRERPVAASADSLDSQSRIQQRKLTTSASAVAIHKQRWFIEEGEERHKRAFSDHELFEQQFDDVLNECGAEDGKLTRNQMKLVFNRVIPNIDDLIFDKIFALFDADGDEIVERNDFMVAMAFLIQQGSARNNIELAFRLFDVDANGEISQKEFNTMICSVLSNRLKYALQTDYGREAFKGHMKREWSNESVEFWETVNKLCEIYAAKNSEKCGVPLSVAQKVFQQYIEEEAPDQINIGSSTHDNIRSSIDRAMATGEETVPIDSFKKAAEEIMQMMELDSFERFRKDLAIKARKASAGYNEQLDYADKAWAELGLDPEKGMTLELFKRWSADNINYFSFLEELQRAVERIVHGTDVEERGEEHEDDASTTKMPTRMYYKAHPSMVSLSTESDENGNTVRIITIGERMYSQNGSTFYESCESLDGQRTDVASSCESISSREVELEEGNKADQETGEKKRIAAAGYPYSDPYALMRAAEKRNAISKVGSHRENQEGNNLRNTANPTRKKRMPIDHRPSVTVLRFNNGKRSSM
uniref:Calmodulin n=1 Tax=Mucochytrium quahogii TaxID=96639 RepID=A0A7S2WST5_9STRA|mmetsp:Transcript_40721/g.65393  ORF Transcript_40721/g.65393 Transcript_40721/m.65393 type:complete len:601 (+) Transcript_40721:193-1995(+)|eukprot:CAMPEP_0203748160 /NCGR_PEP_ID=MMETSP0098-20131031/3106_1 /ASSEMBLY_ACC=CAM_ASM_000208 /TAXON_ID=96639 /ORGANISM=" , Strain NY0313808BC1" /LENGTH=600 /DNA_ID=CAMNT_0050636799 /DNA_START=161 /DNA_END=1963 /DNA_ORIENTATION=-